METTGVAANVLRSLGLNIEDVRNEVINLLGEGEAEEKAKKENIQKHLALEEKPAPDTKDIPSQIDMMKFITKEGWSLRKSKNVTGKKLMQDGFEYLVLIDPNDKFDTYVIGTFEWCVEAAYKYLNKNVSEE